MADGAAHIQVEVAYAEPERQIVLQVRVPSDCVAREAVQASGIAQRLPDVDVANSPVAIFGRTVEADAALRDGDRVEICRPLLVDPKEARRRRAARQRRGD